MLIHTFTEAGEGHTNEDAIAHRSHPANGSFALCALADGQGGRSGGAAAARLAVSSTLDVACEVAPETLLLPSTWFNVCGTADRNVAAANDAGYCTLVGLVITGEWVVGASSGDSAAILILGHAAVILTDRQRKNPPVGSGAAVFETFSAGLGKWWRILVVSDGVWKYVGWEQTTAIGRAAHAHDVAGALRREGVTRSGGKLPDDFSVIVIEP
jgi:hypothetical protein